MSEPRVTQATQANTLQRPSSPNQTELQPPAAKSSHRRKGESARGGLGPTNTADENSLPLKEITLQNYHKVMKFWPLNQIKEQLAQQSNSNHQIGAPVIAEAQAILESFEHRLHMMAMVAGVNVDKLKEGLAGASNTDNHWRRWLSFAKDANKYPMPHRGAPDASEKLALRNSANSNAYNALTADELAVFTSPYFYALGGYPDYSAVSVMQDIISGNTLTIVPKVPKLSNEDEEKFRPIYNKLVDMNKVEKDRALNTPSTSPGKEEKCSLQCIRKISLKVNELKFYIST
ncbi:hypothetical protein DFH28DRAFT_888758 [Melampsora americana]|nr:hypothetical protein DFH28DRAFT_888758 [Melampsora americana]